VILTVGRRLSASPHRAIVAGHPGGNAGEPVAPEITRQRQHVERKATVRRAISTAEGRLGSTIIMV
jgi:hypothetical protein